MLVPKKARGEVSNVLAYSRVRLQTRKLEPSFAFGYGMGGYVSGDYIRSTFVDTNIAKGGQICAYAETLLVQGLGILILPSWKRAHEDDLHQKTSVELDVHGQRFTCGSVRMNIVKLPAERVEEGLLVTEFVPFAEPVVVRHSTKAMVVLRCEAHPLAALPDMNDEPAYWAMVVLVGLRR